MVGNNKRPIVLWLDDKREEIRDEAEELTKANFDVLIAQGIIGFQNHVQEIAHKGLLDQVKLVILDIMLQGVTDISRFYPSVTNGHTAGGYAAGLVFFERVLVLDDRYRGIRGVPIILNSKRALNKPEGDRVKAIIGKYGVKVEVFEKSGTRAISLYLKDCC